MGESRICTQEKVGNFHVSTNFVFDCRYYEVRVRYIVRAIVYVE